MSTRAVGKAIVLSVTLYSVRPEASRTSQSRATHSASASADAHADEFGARLKELAVLAALRRPRPVRAADVEEAQRQRLLAVARRREPSHRHRHVGAEHELAPLVVEEAVAGPEGVVVEQLEGLGELQRGRADLAVAVGGEARPCHALDGVELGGLAGQDVAHAFGDHRPSLVE